MLLPCIRQLPPASFPSLLTPVQNQALHLVSLALQLSPVLSLEVETNLIPLNFCWELFAACLFLGLYLLLTYPLRPCSPWRHSPPFCGCLLRSNNDTYSSSLKTLVRPSRSPFSLPLPWGLALEHNVVVCSNCLHLYGWIDVGFRVQLCCHIPWLWHICLPSISAVDFYSWTVPYSLSDIERCSWPTFALVIFN